MERARKSTLLPILAVILFLSETQRAYANASLPTIENFVPLSISLPVVVVIEALIIYYIARPGILRAFAAAFLMNLVSTFCGVVIFLYLDINPVISCTVIGLFCLSSLMYWKEFGRSTAILTAWIIIAALVVWILFITVLSMTNVSIFFLESPLIWLPFSALMLGTLYSLNLMIEIWPARLFIPSDKLDPALIISNIPTFILVLAALFIGINYW